MFSITVEIDDSWLAPIYNHVHHGACFSLLEQARVALISEMGFSYESLLAEGKALVITGVQAQYKREVLKGPVTVTCDEGEIRGRTLVLRQRIINSKGKDAVTAVIESVFMDIANRRGMEPPEEFAAAFHRLGLPEIS
jgi:YbgC/YbaW family acyl-CoA thioester hydrolase